METTKFTFENGLALRVVDQIENEIPLFIAKDACEILDLKNVSQTIDKLDDDEKLIYKLYISGQERDTWVINESGLYTLIITSNKPEAKQFKRWITHDVLPSIRKAGRYSTKEANDREEEMQLLIHEIEAIEAEIYDEKLKISEKRKICKSNKPS